ncbi:MAG TPA: hypothetical protein VMD09_18070 [Solirubrobacteraceae bacterium]|nr:hypothetical protein [Solirubrobacteraceae bacterium]
MDPGFLDIGKAGFSVPGFRRRRLARVVGFAVAALVALALPAAAGATILPPWGSDLSATPNYDTANGYYQGGTFNTNGNPASANAISPEVHGGDDTAIWNTGSAYTAPQGGQVLAIKVKGCAWEDPTVASDPNGQNGVGPDGQQYSAGVNVRWLDFQAIRPQPDGSYVQDGQTAAGFLMPFCSDSRQPTTGAVNTSTVTTFTPIHLCINQGDTVDFYDIGGYIPNPNGAGWYPNGVPFLVIAGGASGQTLDSFVHAENSPSNFSGANLASEAGEQLQLQVIEGVGEDAYGLCPGGTANEPPNANTVICVYQPTNPGDPYGSCNRDNEPVFAPIATSSPTISGTAAVNQRLNESHAAWANGPGTYKYQWERCDLGGGNCSAISGATNGYYYPVSGDLGDTLRVEEWATNTANTEGPAVSAPTAVVTAGSGTAKSSTGQLSLSLLRLNPASFFAAKGTTVTYKDSRGAATALHIFRLVTGVRRGRSCVAAPKRKRGHVVKCTRLVAVKTLNHQDRAGANALKLRGLSPGKYELEAIATMGQGRSFAIAHFTVKP